MDGQIYFKMSG